MHVFFSGIGGTGIGPLALIAKQAGYEVSGSDTKDNDYIKLLRQKGISDITIGQTADQIKQANDRRPIDWFVYSSALPKTDPNHPELEFCKQNGIRSSKRDEFLVQLLKDKSLKLIAVAGTHGKTTTTAMAIWLSQQLSVPASYSVGAKMSFADMGHYEPGSQWFIYEADEYDRNFLSFYPQVALITGLDWDHPDIYPTQEAYDSAFKDFINQSAQTTLWQDDADKLGLSDKDNLIIIDNNDPDIDSRIKLAGQINRADAWLVAKALSQAFEVSFDEVVEKMNSFPGVSRRFEQIAPSLYSDYAHSPPKVRGVLQLAHEVAGDNVVVVYEGLHNTRQHFIKQELANLFDGVKQLYIVPSYLAREDENLELLTPVKILDLLSVSSKEHSQPALLDEHLKQDIKTNIDNGNLVLALSAGGAGSLDEWLRRQFS